MASIFMMAAAVLLVLLLMWAGREAEGEEATLRSGLRNGTRETLHPSKLREQIFSGEDRAFVLRMKSIRLQRIYAEERRRLALHWVRQTSTEVQRILRAHRLSSRQRQDLNVSTEASLFLQYVELRLLCGLLVALIHMFGPHSLQDLAAYAGELQQRIGKALSGAGPASQVVPTQETGNP